MLEVTRPNARTKAHSDPQRFSWGVVDVILAALMLPFGLWFFLIEGMVHGVTGFGKR
jgi:hypothetical protein